MWAFNVGRSGERLCMTELDKRDETLLKHSKGEILQNLRVTVESLLTKQTAVDNYFVREREREIKGGKTMGLI